MKTDITRKASKRPQAPISEVLSDLQCIGKELQQADQKKTLQALQRPSALSDRRSLVALLTIAGVSLGLPWLVLNTPDQWKAVVIAVAIPLLAAQQCAIGNFAHVAIHMSLFRNRHLNNLATQVLCALMMYSKWVFFSTHSLTHHPLLGNQADLELISRRPAIKPTMSRRRASWEFVRTFAFDRSAWLTTVFGDLPIMVLLLPPHDSLRGLTRQKLFSDLLRCVLVWGILSGLLWLVGGAAFLYTFLSVWFGAKVTAYHLIRVGRELFDHYGLPKNPTGKNGQVNVLDYTRTMPYNWLTYFFNGYSDRLHTLHHLYPSIPMVMLADAHALLMEYAPTYRNRVKMFDTYFAGNNSIMASMIDGVNAKNV
ncbi:fatty acid desaturase family protein [Spirosoma fluviale]|uniref:Fatty acid desaturase n=1 Tax=Spirosoma fluviale TaxID=1597977 RepID=A0A286GSH0_9BACT|nr:fatty acid desaturase [Spirosoma fluviale]SOD98501.1 Fatty acid desaturase [Spirosoma fluviale]